MQFLLFLSNATLLYCQKSTKKWVCHNHSQFFYGCHISLAEQWRIQGPGGRLRAPLFLDQTKARRAEKGFLDDFPTPPPILRSGSRTAEILFFLSVQSENELHGCYEKLTFKPWAIPTAPLNLIQFQLRSRCFKP